MSLYEELKENFTSQLYELEALQSVFPKELVNVDHGVLADIDEFIQNIQKDIPHRLEYTFQFKIGDVATEFDVSLPCNYPDERPDLYARSDSLNRAQQMKLNTDMENYMLRQPENEPCIYNLILWLQDNIDTYVEASKNKQNKNCNITSKNRQAGPSIQARYWIYSHHIYSKTKRREIVDLAKENHLTGFCLAGKPGIICIEGKLEDCEYCWLKIKGMNWHKIYLKLMEKEDTIKSEGNDDTKKFIDFQEISFPSLDRHNDMGQLLIYLRDHESQHVFQELFGIEGQFRKNNSSDISQ